MNRIADELERALAMGESYRETLREHLKGWAFGLHTMSNPDFRAWFEMKARGRWVPSGEIDPMTQQPAIDPMTGQPKQVFEDGPDWVAALEYVEGGMELLRRYERIVEEQDGVRLRV